MPTSFASRQQFPGEGLMHHMFILDPNFLVMLIQTFTIIRFLALKILLTVILIHA